MFPVRSVAVKRLCDFKKRCILGRGGDGKRYGHYSSGVECGRGDGGDDLGCQNLIGKNLVNLLVAKCAYQARD